jgi:hypothetical protein
VESFRERQPCCNARSAIQRLKATVLIAALRPEQIGLPKGLDALRNKTTRHALDGAK